jgi:hypothetical protein
MRDIERERERETEKSGELREMEPDPPWIDASDTSSGRFFQWVDSDGA